jgi:glycosyltransferase involved in cell wall biosynthesis
MQKNIVVAKDGQLDLPTINVLEIIGNADRGGMENYLKNFIAYLPGGFRLTCICPYESEFTSLLRELDIGTVYIAAIQDDPFWNSIQMATEVARLHQINVIHAHMPKAHALAGLVGSLTQKPVVATVHGMEITSHELGITRTVGSHLITNNQEAYLQALALGVSPLHIDLIRNGVDVCAFSPKKTGNDFRRSINVPPDVPLVGFVGRLEYEKGPDLFLKAAEHIHDQMPEVQFVIVGDGSMKEQLHLLSRRMRLDQQVHFVDWQTDNSDIYSALNILTHTSRSDGTSLVLMEAMACTCPTVAIGIGGVLEIVENRSTGLLAADWEDVATKVLYLLERPAMLSSMGIAGRARVEKFFNVSTNTHRVAEVLQQQAIRGSLNLKPVNNLKRINKESLVREIITKDTLQKEL